MNALINVALLSRHSASHALCVCGLLATGALLLAAGCSSHSPSPPPSAPVASAAAVAPGGFVGNAACAECHSGEAERHAASRHMQTLRTMDRTSLGKLSPPTGPIPGMTYTLVTQGEQFELTGQQRGENPFPMQLAFGSGKTGMTFAAVQGANQLAEMRMSYFPSAQRWYVTPGQENMKDRGMGKLHTGDFPRRCVKCHSVTLPETGLIPETRFRGVGCEACHGPGSAHIAAMRGQKAGGSGMESLAKADGNRINELCGACHVTIQQVRGMDLPEDTTHRFQPYGLARSACFQKSKGKLTCLTCHDPHTDASRETKKYEQVCLQCHAAPMGGAKRDAASEKGKICPVNAKEGCIPCHMPLRKVFEDTKIPDRRPDHFIRVHRETAQR